MKRTLIFPFPVVLKFCGMLSLDPYCHMWCASAHAKSAYQRALASRDTNVELRIAIDG